MGLRISPYRISISISISYKQHNMNTCLYTIYLHSFPHNLTLMFCSVDMMFYMFHFCHLFFLANCSPPCQNGGMCLRPQLCVCKPGTKGSTCEDSAKQETTLPGGPGPVTPPWPIPQRSVQQSSFSKKLQVQQKVNPMAQMTFTLKQKPSGGLSQQVQSQ